MVSFFIIFYFPCLSDIIKPVLWGKGRMVKGEWSFARYVLFWRKKNSVKKLGGYKGLKDFKYSCNKCYIKQRDHDLCKKLSSNILKLKENERLIGTLLLEWWPYWWGRKAIKDDFYRVSNLPDIKLKTVKLIIH